MANSIGQAWRFGSAFGGDNFGLCRNNKPDEAIAYLKECSETEDEGQIINCRYATLEPENRKKVEALSPAQRARLDEQLAKNDDALTQKAGIKNFTSALSTPAGQPAPAATPSATP